MTNDNALVLVEDKQIQNLIYTIRGKQVMIDRDLAELYQVQTKRLNEQVKRNINRFPEEFCFQLDDKEKDELVANCDRFEMLKHSSSNPYAFTEQGIAMLSAVLRSDVAVKVSVKIMNTFVEMRRFLISNGAVFERLDRVELKQLETDQKFEKVFNYIASQTEVKQNIFYDGQIYDAFSFIVDLIKKAKTKLILIDNYVDTNTLNMLCKKNTGVDVKVVTAGKGSLTTKDITKFNAQYSKLSVKTMNDFHDRFLIIDDKEVYHIGASIKDAGKKSFGITKIEDNDLIKSLINKVR
ncbi:MAG: ORF6N domain-containing protein [Tissierellia bacterium]|nr:ORF6N domain-containing protein [Tissierellia bacterium]